MSDTPLFEYELVNSYIGNYRYLKWTVTFPDGYRLSGEGRTVRQCYRRARRQIRRYRKMKRFLEEQ